MKADDLLARLADVEPPPAPDWAPIAYAIAGVVAVAIIALAVILRRRHTHKTRRPVPGAEARARLSALQDAWERGEIASRTAAYRLATLLRLALGLTQLDMHSPPAGIEPHEWITILERLRASRYTRQTATLDAELFARIASCLAMHETEACVP